MLNIIKITLKGIFRDRVFQGIMALVVLFLFIPSAASLSMRQVTGEFRGREFRGHYI